MKMLLTIVFCLVCLMLTFSAFAEMLGGGDLMFRPSNADPVMFSHEKHVAGSGLKCTGCHFHVFQMQQGSYKMEMSTITKGVFCGKCHNGQKAFDVSEPRNCVRCHK